MRFRIPTLVILLAFVFTSASWAQVSSGMDFLNIGANAYTLSLAEAQTATLLGPTDLYANPANLAMESRSGLGADYTLWIVDTNNSHVAANFRNGNQAFAAGVYSSQVNDFESRYQPGPSRGSFNISYLSLAGAYAYRWRFLSAGVTAQYLSENYLANRASGYAFNIGLAATMLDNRLRLAAVLLNAGRMDKLNQTRSKLPTNLRVGTMTQLVRFTTGANDLNILIRLHGDVVFPLHETNQPYNETADGPGGFKELDQPYVNIGTSIEIARLIDLRVGYKTQDSARNFSFGAGIRANPIRFNYAMIPFTTGFGTAHSIGIQYFFD